MLQTLAEGDRRVSGQGVVDGVLAESLSEGRLGGVGVWVVGGSDG